MTTKTITRMTNLHDHHPPAWDRRLANILTPALLEVRLARNDHNQDHHILGLAQVLKVVPHPQDHQAEKQQATTAVRAEARKSRKKAAGTAALVES